MDETSNPTLIPVPMLDTYNQGISTLLGGETLWGSHRIISSLRSQEVAQGVQNTSKNSLFFFQYKGKNTQMITYLLQCFTVAEAGIQGAGTASKGGLVGCWGCQIFLIAFRNTPCAHHCPGGAWYQLRVHSLLTSHLFK